MFQKKDYIYSETMGVCRVADITNLAPKKGTAVAYYVLKSVYQKDKVAYIPVENHTVELRELISLEQAQALSEEWKGAEEKGLADFEMQYKMADTLPKETRELLYKKGEVEFVLSRK